MTKTPIVSVVTPFYNTADYLEQCIESVLGQTLGDFEYLLCDNASTDGSTEIAEAYASKDSRIRFLRFEELIPQVPNYNRALEYASPAAQWCKIVQADDWLYGNCLERMVAVGELDPEIGLVSSYHHSGRRVHGTGLPIEKQVFDGKEACRYQLRERIFFMGSPTSVMYRMSMVQERKPFYGLGRYHEDTEVAYEILEHHKLGFVHEVLTSLRVDNPSIMGRVSGFNPRLLDFLVSAHRFAHRFLEPEEADEIVRTVTKEYYRYLGESVLELRPKEFWDYHREGVAATDMGWSTARIALGTSRAAAFVLLNPLSTLQSLRRKLRSTT